jgi:transcription antitermination factor NusG
MKWYILYTRYHHERAVHERLVNRGFQAYLPLSMGWRKSQRSLRKVGTPLFPRYVFVRCYLEVYAHLELVSIPGVMQLLEDTQGRVRVVPDDEIRLMGKLCDAGFSLERTGYQLQGQLMEVIRGRLQGIAGVIRNGPKPSLLVPLHTLQTSVAVDIDRDQLLPCTRAETLRRNLFPPDSTVER